MTDPITFRTPMFATYSIEDPGMPISAIAETDRALESLR